MLKNVEHPDSRLWDTLAMIALKWPLVVGVLAGMAYLGRQMMEPELAPRRIIIGGIMVACFTGTASFYLLESVGVPQNAAAAAAMFLGSTGEIGYQLLVERAKQMTNGK